MEGLLFYLKKLEVLMQGFKIYLLRFITNLNLIEVFKEQIYNKATSIRGVLEPFTSKANIDYMKELVLKTLHIKILQF